MNISPLKVIDLVEKILQNENKKMTVLQIAIKLEDKNIYLDKFDLNKILWNPHFRRDHMEVDENFLWSVSTKKKLNINETYSMEETQGIVCCFKKVNPDDPYLVIKNEKGIVKAVNTKGIVETDYRENFTDFFDGRLEELTISQKEIVKVYHPEM